MLNHSKLRSQRIWIATLVLIILIIGIVQLFISRRNSQERFISSNKHVSSIIHTYTTLTGFNVAKAISPQASCRESNYNSLSLNRHFECTMSAGAILTTGPDANIHLIQSQLVTALTSQKVKIYPGAQPTDNLPSTLEDKKFWSEGFGLEGTNTSVVLYLAAPGNTKAPTTYNFGGATGTNATRQMMDLWPSSQNKDAYTLLVYVENAPYDSCTSFFLPICSARLVSSK